MTLRSRVQCVECGRVFDLMYDRDASEWYEGHDCEVQAVVYNPVVCEHYQSDEVDGRCNRCGAGPHAH